MHTRARLLLALIAGSGLASVLVGCSTEPATAPQLVAVPAPVRASLPGPTADASVLGLYLAGSSAANQGRNDIAVEYLAKAAGMVDEGNKGFLKEQAFRAAIGAGRIEDAVVLAPDEGQASVNNVRLGRLVIAINALATGDAAKALETMRGDNIGPPYRNAVLLLRPWAAAAAGDVATATAAPEARGDSMTQAYALHNRALLLERAGKAAEADAIFKGLVGQDTRIPLFAVNYGAFLERQGRRGEAVALYDSLLAERAGDIMIKAARERARGRKAAPPAPTIQQGVSMSLVALAQTAMNQNQTATAVDYLQLVLRIDPQRNDARLFIADWMQSLGNAEGARAGYAAIPRGAQEYLMAQRRLAASYAAADEDDQALRVARDAAREFPDDIDAQVLLADMLRQTKDFPAAVTVLNKLVTTEGKTAPWQLYFSRAIALEKSGNWPAAEKDLKAALVLAPNEPQLQNYLGYTWADRGENIPEALDLLNKAARAQPTSGAILDSLGWAYFRSGDSKLALTYLEQAVEREPSDPDINNHLGDVYLKVGRGLEARYQWERVLTLDPEPAMKADVTAKLAAHPEETKAAAAVAVTEPVQAP